MNLKKVHVHVLGNVIYEIEKKTTPVGMLKDCYGKKRDNSETKNIVR